MLRRGLAALSRAGKDTACCALDCRTSSLLSDSLAPAATSFLRCAPSASVATRGIQSQPTASSAAGGYMGTGSIGHAKGSADYKPRFLITGANGQIGKELVTYMRQRFGVEDVIASDIKMSRSALESGPFVYCDVTDYDSVARVILENGIDYVVHLASVLSAIGERNPALALKVNSQGIQNVLELARLHNLQVYSPSTIAVFGASTPKLQTPDSTVKEPSTMYGITKVHLELLGEYYRQKFGVDFRSLRYPGIISNTAPGGGTTDYAVEIYFEALAKGHYDCWLAPDVALPMMYMDDCLKATVDLMMAPRESLTQCCYNISAMSFTPEEQVASIRRFLPEFTVSYHPDYRQGIAETWPSSLDDSLARRDWGWEPDYDIHRMSEHMLKLIGDEMKAQEAK